MIYVFLPLGLVLVFAVLSLIDLERQLHKYDEEMKEKEKKSNKD